jgi:8-hydroxy-5-deazaflavin:NADPH oxidoreductase
MSGQYQEGAGLTIVSFVSGTGPAGFGLAARFARAGDEVVIGSRAIDRAEEARAMVLQHVPDAKVRAATNLDAIDVGDVVFLTMPAQAQRESVEAMAKALAGKIVVSMSNPVQVEGGKVVTFIPEAGSIAEEVQQLVPTARVVGAFHEIHVRRFAKLDRRIDSDTIVTGDDNEAKQVVMRLCGQVDGIRAIDGGPLSLTRFVEGFVAVLISINLRYKAGTSLRITGLPEG